MWTYQKQRTSRKDSAVSDAPTTTIRALITTLGSMVSFLLSRLRVNGGWTGIQEEDIQNEMRNRGGEDAGGDIGKEIQETQEV